MWNHQIILSIGGRLIQRSNMSKKGYCWLPWLSVFLRTSLPYFCIGSKLWFDCKVWPLGVFSVTGITRLSCAHVGSHWIPMHRGSPGILCSRGTSKALCTWSSSERLTRILLGSPAFTHLCLHAFPVLWTSLAKYELKNKITKDFRTVTAEH